MPFTGTAFTRDRGHGVPWQPPPLPDGVHRAPPLLSPTLPHTLTGGQRGRSPTPGGPGGLRRPEPTPGRHRPLQCQLITLIPDVTGTAGTANHFKYYCLRRPELF